MESIFEMHNRLFPGHLFSVGGGVAIGVFAETEVGLRERGLECLGGVCVVVGCLVAVGRGRVRLLVHGVVAQVEVRFILGFLFRPLGFIQFGLVLEFTFIGGLKLSPFLVADFKR